MINIKDKLARTNILIQRTQDAVAEYVTEDVFYDKITEINKELDELEDGILNSYSTGVSEGIQQQKAKLGTISITENGEYIKEDGYNKVLVNVEGTSPINFREIRYDSADTDNILGKINADIAYSQKRMAEWDSMMSGETPSKLKEFFKNDKDIVYCPYIGAEFMTDMSNFFANCEKMIYVPLLDTENVRNMFNMFGFCLSIEKIPNFDTSNVTTMYSMFNNCQMLKEIPNFDTSYVENVESMFVNCSRLEKIPLLDFGKVYNIRNFFYFTNVDRLTDLGGFKNLKIDWNDNNGLARCKNLTHESIMNVITNLWDFRENGDTTTTKILQLNTNSMALLSDDDKAIATNKGWTLTA